MPRKRITQHPEERADNRVHELVEKLPKYMYIIMMVLDYAIGRVLDRLGADVLRCILSTYLRTLCALGFRILFHSEFICPLVKWNSDEWRKKFATKQYSKA